MRDEGFLLYTDIGQAFLETVEKAQIPELRHCDIQNGLYYEEYSSSVVLCTVTQAIRGAVRTAAQEDEGWHNRMSTEEVIATRDMTFSNGLGDLDFTWHFSAAMASTVVQKMVQEGVIDRDVYDDFTLTDWATVIESDWFSSLIHTCAFAENGIWGEFGRSAREFTDNALDEHLLRTFGHKIKPLEIYKVNDDPDSDLHAYGAKATATLKNALRGSLRQARSSIGCPVARLALRTEQGRIDNNVHARSLIDSGRVAIEPTENDRVILRQGQTIISDALMVFGAQLREYEQQYGTPYFEDCSTEWKVHHRQTNST